MWNSVISAVLFIEIALITSVAGTVIDESTLELSDEGASFPTNALNPLPSTPIESQGVASNFLSSPGLDLDLDHLGPENVVMSSSPLSVTVHSIRIFPRIHSDDDSEVTSSTSLNLVANQESGNEEETNPGFSPKEVVVIAICVSLLSLVVVVISVAMSFLIRRRMRRKAYLRVKHASQTELAVHFVQNTPASVAARDSAMEQLFQSLASIDPDAHSKDYCQMNYENEERCLSPTESIASTDFIEGKSKTYSGSLPSLKILNAHEEALNCNLANVFQENSGKLKGRSRSFTERAALGVDITRAKTASRSHSEKLKNRVFLPTAGKRFEKKSNNKSSRFSAPSFSRLARFGLLRNQSVKRKPVVPAETGVKLPCVVRHSDATDVAASDSKQSNDCLHDFEMPTMSPILQDMGPMLTAMQHSNDPIRRSQLSVRSGMPNDKAESDKNSPRTSQISMQSETGSGKRRDRNGCSNSQSSLQSGIQNGRILHSSEVAIHSDAESNTSAPNRPKIPSFEEVRGDYLHGPRQKSANSAIESARKNFSSAGHLETSCKDRSVGNHNKQTIS